MPQPGRRVIAVHLVVTLYGHWAVNDPRGSGSGDFIDDKFEPLGPIHFGRKPRDQQPTRKELRAFHARHEELLNFPVFWVDDAKREEIADATAEASGRTVIPAMPARSAETMSTSSSARTGTMR